ncbi:acetyl-CoA carboxylase biotin carboxylase subunit family protein [Kitasatospora sp. NPDC056446]|uniref:ATP-grasp domain-containing protein n=1 Tax=Kitasatospora sp. NPDC056446 TaxID=3345819 RepID=UPI00368EA2CE
MPSSDGPPYLLLNTKSILHRLPEWFPDAGQDLVVVSTPGALAGADAADRARDFRHLHLLDSFDGPSVEDELAALAERFGVRRVLSTGERDVLRAARLRERLGLPGQDVPAATAYRDKYVMKSLLAAAGVPVAPMRRLRSVRDLTGFAEEFGFPVVVKRLDAGGSNGTRVLWDRAGLDGFAAGWDPGRPGAPQLAEAWVEGDFYQVNGLMDDGRIVLGQPSCHPYSDWFSVAFDAPGMSGMMSDAHPLSARLGRTAADVVAALPPTPGLTAFQVEVFHTPDDRLVVCEAACRAGGSRMVDTHEATLGVNLHGASLLGQAGLGDRVVVAPTGERQGYARFPPARGVLRRLPRHCPLPATLSYSAPGEEGRAYDGSTALGPYVAEVVFSLSGPDTAAEMREVEQWWDDNVVWEDRRNAVPDRWKATARTPRAMPAAMSRATGSTAPSGN